MEDFDWKIALKTIAIMLAMAGYTYLCVRVSMWFITPLVMLALIVGFFGIYLWLKGEI